MKEKGFTLIELLAVIVILAIIALIAVPIIIDIINDARESSYKRSIELYGTAVKNAIAKKQLNKEIVPTGELDINSLNIEYNGTEVSCETNILYEDGSIYLAECTVGTHEVEYTYGKTQICKLVEGTSKTIGSKYTCTLDQNRTFYVLENNQGSDSISLIMDSNYVDDNVPVTMPWCIDNTTNASTCKNVSSKDEGTYLNGIQELFGNDVVVGIPNYNQINNSIVDSTIPSWLGNVNDYWTSSLRNSDNLPWRIHILNGNITLNACSPSVDGRAGIRPTITISKEDLN